MSHTRPGRRFALALAGAGGAALLTLSGVVDRLDLWAYDMAARVLRGPPPETVAVVGIDERSLRELGRWPWPRRLHAEIVRRLDAAGAAAIGYDVVFAERDAVDPLGDLELARALAASGKVAMPVFPEPIVTGAPPIAVAPAPLFRIQVALGHVDVEIDGDGLVRGTFLRAGPGAASLPTLAGAVLGIARGEKPTSLPGQGPASGWLRADPVRVPFLGPPGRFPPIAASDLLAGMVPAAALAGRMVLVGATAPGLGDVLPTPVSAASHPMSGVEFNANLLAALAGGGPVRTPSTAAAAAISAALTALLLAFALGGGPVRRAAFAAAAAVAGAVLVLALLRVFWSPAPVLILLPAVVALDAGLRRMEERRAARAEQARAHAALHAVADGVLTLTADGRILDVNPAASRILDHAPGDLVGRTFDRLCTLRPLPSSDRAPIPLCRLRVRGQAERLVRVCHQDVRDAAGRVQVSVVTLTDLTEEERTRRAAEAGRRRLQHLERKLAQDSRRGAMAQLVATIAHEINQPLAAILAYAGAGRRLAGSEGADIVASFERVAGQAERAGEVVRRLRRLFEGGVPSRSRCSPNELISEVVALVASQHPQIRIETELAPQLADVALDRVQIQQMMVNLMQNAIEAPPSGEPHCVRVSSRLEGDELVLEVKDNGAGFDEAMLGRAFEPFATSKAKGTGVGLALCRAVAEAHGGRITVRNRAGGGAVVTVRLPVEAGGGGDG